MDEIGRKIRDERKKKGLTLEGMAEQTGLSKSYLSNLERGLTEPTVSVLKKVATQLRLSLIELFGGSFEPGATLGYPPSGGRTGDAKFVTDVRVVRPEQRKTFTLAESSLTFELLTPDLNRQFEVYQFRARPGEKMGQEAMVDPPGEKFALVLSGVMETRVGDQVYTLEPGCTIYFPSNLPHNWRAVGEETLVVVVVVYPPWF